jgi:hypothetical protein
LNESAEHIADTVQPTRKRRKGNVRWLWTKERSRNRERENRLEKITDGKEGKAKSRL